MRREGELRHPARVGAFGAQDGDPAPLAGGEVDRIHPRAVAADGPQVGGPGQNLVGYLLHPGQPSDAAGQEADQLLLVRETLPGCT